MIDQQDLKRDLPSCSHVIIHKKIYPLATSTLHDVMTIVILSLLMGDFIIILVHHAFRVVPRRQC
jgi:hypothetical protein